MSSIKITKYLLDEFGLKANKRYGQNFLIDDNILENIVEVSNVDKMTNIIEIGPGLDNLTDYLVKQAKTVKAVEIDENMIDVLFNRFKGVSNLEVINQDILKVDINEIIGENENIKIIGNLPYYITTPIIFHILENTNKVDSITIMIQKEVADRIVAAPGNKDYGVLSIMTNIYSEAKLKFEVSPNCFMPAPKVNSSIVVLNCKKNRLAEIKDIKLFRKIVKSAFMQRRKTLVNSISNNTEFTKENLINILKEMGINENIRAEGLSIDSYIQLVNLL